MVTEMVIPKSILRDEKVDLNVKIEQEKSNKSIRSNRFPHLQRNTHGEK